MIEETIRSRLAFLNTTTLEILDESHLHKGHAGNNGGGHFNVLVKSPFFV